MLKKQLLSIIALVAAFAMTTPSMASDNNWYGVFSIGSSQFEANSASVDFHNGNSGFTSSTTSTSMSGKASPTGGKAQLGYQFGKTFALESGITYLGKANFTSITNLGLISGNVEAWLLNLDLVAKFPFAMEDKLSVLGRFGGYYWKTESEMPTAAPFGTNTFNDTGLNFKIGAGLQYEFTPKFSLRGEYERYNGIGNSQTSGDNKVNQWTVGAVVKF